MAFFYLQRTPLRPRQPSVISGRFRSWAAICLDDVRGLIWVLGDRTRNKVRWWLDGVTGRNDGREELRAEIERLDNKIAVLFAIMGSITDTMGISRDGVARSREPVARHLNAVPPGSGSTVPLPGNPRRPGGVQSTAPGGVQSTAPRARRDSDAPFGRNEDGSPVAKFGYKRDGSIRLTRQRLSKPVAKPKQADGTLPARNSSAASRGTIPQPVAERSRNDSAGRVRRTLRRIASWLLLGLPRRRALRRARLAGSVRRHPSGIAA